MPGRHRRERGVLGVGGEDPRVVRPARAHPPGASTVPAGGGNCVPSRLANTRRSRALLDGVGEVLLGPPLLCSSRSPGRSTRVRAATRARSASLRRRACAGGERARRDSTWPPRQPSSEPATANHTVRPSGRHVQRVGEPPAGAPAVRAVVAARRRAGSASRADHRRVLRAAVAGAERVAVRGERAADHGGVVVRPLPRRPVSRKTRLRPSKPPVSGRLTVAWLGVVHPHGYAESSSECASTDSVTRRAASAGRSARPARPGSVRHHSRYADPQPAGTRPSPSGRTRGRW